MIMPTNSSPPTVSSPVVPTARASAKLMNRRSFLKNAALAGGAVAVPCIIPASVLGRNGTVPPSERIVLGGMGVGGRGSYVLSWMLPEPDVQFVAICDAKKSSREAVKRTVDTRYGNQDC